MLGKLEQGYVDARSVLLDALIALEPHLSGVVLVGAQAVYLRTEEGELAVSPYTEDADMALDPRALAGEPLIERQMDDAGFVRGTNPGSWRGKHNVVVDLMVPEGLVEIGGRRSAGIPPHATQVARRTKGLEACLVDFTLENISSLDPMDRRTVSAKVAGAAALLVAKAFKLGERHDKDRERLQPKDALDVYRLLIAVPTDSLVDRFEHLLGDPVAGPVTREAIGYLGELFASLEAVGPELVARALEQTDQPEVGREAVFRLAQSLLAKLARFA